MLSEKLNFSYSGFGDKATQLFNQRGKMVCLIGEQDNERKFWFPEPVSLSNLQDLVETLRNKKLLI